MDAVSTTPTDRGPRETVPYMDASAKTPGPPAPAATPTPPHLNRLSMQFERKLEPRGNTAHARPRAHSRAGRSTATHDNHPTSSDAGTANAVNAKNAPREPSWSKSSVVRANSSSG
jgi:hypothetical protein